MTVDRMRRTFAFLQGVVLSLAIPAGVAFAQQTPNARDAWHAAREVVLQWRNAPDSSRLVGDTIAVRALFETCEGAGGSDLHMVFRQGRWSPSGTGRGFAC